MQKISGSIKTRLLTASDIRGQLSGLMQEDHLLSGCWVAPEGLGLPPGILDSPRCIKGTWCTKAFWEIWKGGWILATCYEHGTFPRWGTMMDGIRKRPIFPESLPASLRRSQQLQNDFAIISTDVAVISTAFCRHKGAVDKIPVCLNHWILRFTKLF